MLLLMIRFGLGLCLNSSQLIFSNIYAAILITAARSPPQWVEDESGAGTYNEQYVATVLLISISITIVHSSLLYSLVGEMT